MVLITYFLKTSYADHSNPDCNNRSGSGALVDQSFHTNAIFSEDYSQCRSNNNPDYLAIACLRNLEHEGLRNRFCNLF